MTRRIRAGRPVPDSGYTPPVVVHPQHRHPLTGWRLALLVIVAVALVAACRLSINL